MKIIGVTSAGKFISALTGAIFNIGERGRFGEEEAGTEN